MGTMVEGQGPERTRVFGCVDCSVAFGVEVVEVNGLACSARRSQSRAAARCVPGSGGPRPGRWSGAEPAGWSAADARVE